MICCFIISILFLTKSRFAKNFFERAKIDSQVVSQKHLYPKIGIAFLVNTLSISLCHLHEAKFLILGFSIFGIITIACVIYLSYLSLQKGKNKA